MSKNTIVAESHELFSESFPYVLWPLIPTVYSFQPIPPSVNREAALHWIADLTRSIRRKCALVLGPSDCVYYDATGQATWSDQPPTGGVAFRAAIAIPEPPANYSA
jgi:hypothetical protein